MNKIQKREFAGALAKIERHRLEQEGIDREKPRLEFRKAAIKAGFSIKQTEFMWGWLALTDHEHWNGRIG